MILNNGLNNVWIRSFGIVGIIGVIILSASFGMPCTSVNAQQPTGSIPTVTGTPSGPFVTAYANKIKVYAGPSSYKYIQIYVLLARQTAPALGRSPDGDWILIYCPGVPGSVGWVYAPLVSLSPGSLPIVLPPSTATPRTTPTIDPILAAAFAIPLTPTRLPTFTPAPPLVIPTYPEQSGTSSGLPMGLVIFGLGFIGVIGAVSSFLRGR